MTEKAFEKELDLGLASLVVAFAKQVYPEYFGLVLIDLVAAEIRKRKNTNHIIG